MILRIFALFFLLGCSEQRNSPFSDESAYDLANLNQNAMEQVKTLNPSSWRIAIFTDSHANYNDLNEIIDQMNLRSDIHFAVVLGDFTNSGYNIEYDQFLDSYINLRHPSLVLMGNHDALGTGVELFKRIFGPVNFFFEITHHRLIFFNSAYLESPENFDANWLLKTVRSSSKDVIIFTHVPLTDKLLFTSEIREVLDQVVAHPRVQLVVNGHNNVFSLGKKNGTHLLQVPRVEGAQWMILDLYQSRAHFEMRPEGEKKWLPLK